MNGKEKEYFGTDKNTKDKIYIRKPSFDNGWYWSLQDVEGYITI